MEQSAREQRTDEAKPSQLSVIRLGTERSETTDYRRRDNKTTDNKGKGQKSEVTGQRSEAGDRRSETTPRRGLQANQLRENLNRNNNSCVQRDLVALLLPFIFGAIPINYSAPSLFLSNMQLVSFTLSAALTKRPSN